MQSAARTRGLLPGPPIHGSTRPPGSKSIAQRALLAAGLAHGRTSLKGLPDAADVRAALAVVEALGAEVEAKETGVAIHGTAGVVRDSVLRVGESGTLARLSTAVAGFCGAEQAAIRIVASGSLVRRQSVALFRALEEAGVEVCFEGDAYGWPVTLRSARPKQPSLSLASPGSSQEVSALLLASAALGGRRSVICAGNIPSLPYIGLTLDVLQRFGVEIDEEVLEGRTEWRLRGELSAPEHPLEIEADASSAAVALAAGCLSGGRVEVRGVGEASSQGDVRIVEHLRAFGCQAAAQADGLWAAGRPRHAANLCLVGEPDLAPVLAAVAAAAALASGETSRLIGLETLRGKESDRIQVLAEGLRRTGWEALEGDDRLEIGPGDGPAGDVVLDPAGDHRMAFAFGLLGLLREGVSVREPDCVSKSWPGFWDALANLGAQTSGA